MILESQRAVDLAHTGPVDVSVLRQSRVAQRAAEIAGVIALTLFCVAVATW